MDAKNLSISDEPDLKILLQLVHELQERTERMERELRELKEARAVAAEAANIASPEPAGAEKHENEQHAAKGQTGQTHPDESPAMDLLLRELGHINDLSLVHGFAKANRDKQLYLDRLRQFCQEAETYIETLNDAIQRLDWDSFFAEVQVLKKIFDDLGNQFLTDWAADLEHTFKEGKVGKCRKQTRPFCDNLRSFRARLLETSLMDGVDEDEQTGGNDLREKLDALIVACLECDTDGIDAIIVELRAMDFGEERNRLLTEICALAESFDYGDVIVKCELLLKILLEESGS
jgi:HPt (histidine-containing phosphotransfer) domain-containing protein